MSTPQPGVLSAIVPVLDGAELLERSLAPLLAAVGHGLLEVLVVDDGSSDDSARLARDLGARVLDSGGRARGPAAARNLAAEEARGELLLFVDADVVVHADAIERVLAAFEDPTVGALYGSYDTSPPERNYASLYMNLRHHHGHRLASDDAPTFWSGLGAVRREAFRAVRGFDVARFPYPSVEDIDLGRRLRATGTRIVRDPRVLGTHLKRWSWRGVVHTDIVRRALPWARLMLAHPGEFDDLNVGRAEQLKALLAAGWIASIGLALAGLLPWWAALAGFVLVLAANAGLVRVFLYGGLPFALVGALFHQLYYLYASATFVLCRLRGEPRPAQGEA